MTKNKVILRLGIFDFNDITHAEITDLLQVSPVITHVKGEKRNPKNPNSPLIKQNRWMMESGLKEYSSFEDQMESFLIIIESKIEIFKPLCKKYYWEFSCAIFVYFNNGESTPWVHLDSRYNNMLKELNIEFDIDLYVLPNDEE